jgi:DNA-binding CsgD family transcriptional regulator
MTAPQVRFPEKIIAATGAHRPLSGNHVRPSPFGSGEKPAVQKGAHDMKEPLIALRVLNAALIAQNRALRAALSRRERQVGAVTGYSRGIGMPKVDPSFRMALRQVAIPARRQTERPIVAHFETCLAELTPRQTQILDLVLAGHPSKNIAADLNISQRTVENHRAAIMQRTGATSLPALARMAVGAADSADQRGTG